MAIRPRGRKRSLSKKVSSFNMYMDQMYQIRAIMEATGAEKDAPVIRELLDEALGARRRKGFLTVSSKTTTLQARASISSSRNISRPTSRTMKLLCSCLSSLSNKTEIVRSVSSCAWRGGCSQSAMPIAYAFLLTRAFLTP